MTITNDPSTPSIHQQQDHPLDQEGKGRSDKQSPNRAGIRMPRVARLDDRSEFNTPSEGAQSARLLHPQDVH
jgi:hypothetical protein